MTKSGKTQHFFEVDDTFANYTIKHFCGRGAYGEVYLAEDITHKTVALKIIPVSGGSEVWRMELIGLRHYRQSIENYDSLIEILHVGETDNFFYYTMEAADNMLHGDTDDYIADTLAHRLERGGRLEPEKVLELANALLDALEHLAEHNLAHRDIKPANIVFINGQAKLSDIGLISSTGVRSKVVGTLEFLPPEIADDDPVGYGHDLYSLGKVLYCALTGLLPENYPEVPLTVPLRAWSQFKGAILKACVPDPRARFFTPEEFRAALPTSIKATTWVDEAVEHMRSYCKEHPKALRLSIISITLMTAAMLISGYLSILQKKELERQRNERLNFIYRTIDVINDHQLHLQRIAANSGNTALPWHLQAIAEMAADARAAGDWHSTEQYCRSADNMLKMWSKSEFRTLQQKYPAEELPNTTAELLELLKQYRDFDLLPLSEYLISTYRQQLDSTIDRITRQLAARWQGPMPGKNWVLNHDPDLEMLYIPKGMLPGEPSNSYWIGVNELTCRSLRKLRPDLYKHLPDSTLPVTGLSWNDRLTICRNLTISAQQKRTLPPGYIYRLPYAGEWNFVMHGAWESPGNFLHEEQSVGNYAWFGGNSMYKLHSVRNLQKGIPGVYDFIGNAAESVLLQPTVRGGKPQAGNFGGSFRDRRLSSNLNLPVQLDMLRNNWSGMRLVLAPGDMDYFENNYYSGQTYTALRNGTVYELLGSPDCRWTPEAAADWSRLTGCQQAVLEDFNLRKELFQSSQRMRELPVLLGTSRINGKWYWLNQQPIRDGGWFNLPDNSGNNQNKFLVWDHGFWRELDIEDTVPLIMISYPADRRFSAKSSPLENLSAVKKEFSIKNRKYLLLQAPVDWYTAKRLAELLGVKLASPSIANDPAAAAILDEFKTQTIALDGCQRNGKWVDSNGSEIKTAEKLRPPAGLTPDNCFITLQQGKLACRNNFDLFLCEYP
ncbi:MAG: hypothetical protein E7056_06105 [Lentisphaerae bacterium]|nr:hypothetical protein [Lentisphaerota bacterium]